MTKILFLIDSLPHGGAERQLCLLLKYLPPAWEARLVTLGGGPYYQVLQDQRTPVAVYQRRSRFDLSPALQIYTEIMRYKPDIIHSWGGLCSALVAPICKVFQILLIGSIRTGAAFNTHYWRTKITYLLCDHIVANNFAGLAAYQIPIEKSSVVYNAIEPERLEQIKRRFGEQGDITTVIMTGRIYSHKDFRSYFEAARRLNAKEPGRWKFVAVGAGEEDDQKYLMHLAGDLIAAGVVEFPRAELDVLPYLSKANIGVLLNPSNVSEGFSNSIMEYMVCELPVICTDGGGNRELVVDGETGFFVPPENVDSLVDKLLFLKNHPDISCGMGKAGYKRVRSLCSIDRMINEYEVLYNRLLGKRRHGV